MDKLAGTSEVWPLLDVGLKVEAEAMSDVDLAKIFRHMLLGVAHTHGVGIVHRDIKRLGNEEIAR